jgi:HSP20 family protein
MTLNRWDPFKELLALQERMNRMAEADVAHGAYVRQQSWSPAVDILETPDRYLFRIDLPGIPQEDIIIEVHGRMLVIRGDRPTESEPRMAAFHRIERNSGFFQRRFTLPGDIDAERTTAQYKNGVLEIELPKAEKPKNRDVAVVCLG